MAKAIERTINEPQGLLNQQANNQTDTPQIPIPRDGRSHESLTHIELFTIHIPEQKIHDTTTYIEASSKFADTLRIGSFIIILLERLGSIPSEVSAEDTEARTQAIRSIEQLLIDYDTYAHPSGNGYDTTRFSEEVTDKIDDESLVQYALVTILAQAIQRVRATGNRSAESMLVTTQRITMLGIAKQRGVYK